MVEATTSTDTPPEGGAVTVELVPRLDFHASEALAEALEAARDKPVQADASNVVYLGGSCLQVLVAGQKQWEKDGVSFAISQPSEAFLSSAKLLGVSPEQFEGNTQ